MMRSFSLRRRWATASTRASAPPALELARVERERVAEPERELLERDERELDEPDFDRARELDEPDDELDDERLD
jgi:hypothetical protein